ncbi:MAG: gamma-glutamyl-gamma-aminobutyrate hydrolase [Planctomycetaceae bacterium]|jgi:putative glutamine amidotransferase|nr:gamma-glutamyl-gamma-aminobutyrate hydrolase [Planctomycetaceae bacterium]MBP61148.1 gamma-glutamyl-gamma-aminobutyrate hydrolase [Planctomycetaceae bacterium]
MQTKPLIGINSDYRSATKNRPSYSVVCGGYFDSILKAGGIPVIVPPLDDRDDIHSALKLLQGFLLIGGPDLDPQRDGFMRHPSVRPMEDRRESFDRMLVDAIAERSLPVLGIGVGLQLINVSQGGNLFLHVPEDIPRALPHKDQLDINHRHGLEVVPGTIMERVYGDGEVRVNSMHHMAIDELAPGFAVTARSPDGVIEAIESQIEDWFVLGTQFHPEGESASALDQRIFEEFLAGVSHSSFAMRMVA